MEGRQPSAWQIITTANTSASVCQVPFEGLCMGLFNCLKNFKRWELLGRGNTGENAELFHPVAGAPSALLTAVSQSLPARLSGIYQSYYLMRCIKGIASPSCWGLWISAELEALLFPGCQVYDLLWHFVSPSNTNTE